VIAASPPAFARARDLVTPALREAVERLSAGIREVVVYHLGWAEVGGRSAESDGGKAVRPALAFACAEAVGSRPEVAIPGAVAVELVHNFSLLHDDVMDGDTERRHRPTAWSVFGVGEAILAGDALLSLAHELLIDPPTEDRLRAASALSDATTSMITGQAEDLSFERRTDVSVAECLAMLEHKTAALIACSCRVGGILGGAGDRTVRVLGEFGLHLGLAYQAIDDVLGIWGRPETTGKPAWSDLRQRKKTLPVAAALEAGGVPAAFLRELLARESLADEDVARAAALVEENGGREMALRVAGEHLAQALTKLAEVHVPAPVRRDLEEIAGFITTREF
jgi:geranylgeranyl diphosphate synthase type I